MAQSRISPQVLSRWWNWRAAPRRCTTANRGAGSPRMACSGSSSTPTGPRTPPIPAVGRRSSAAAPCWITCGWPPQAGWHTHVAHFPNPNDLDHLATINFHPSQGVTTEETTRADAIRRRRTDRLPFAAPLDWPAVEMLLQEVVDPRNRFAGGARVSPAQTGRSVATGRDTAA